MEDENNILDRLERIWMTCIPCDNIDTSTSFFDLGGSSLSAMKVCVEIKRTFSISIKMSEFNHKTTILDQLKIVNSKILYGV